MESPGDVSPREREPLDNVWRGEARPRAGTVATINTLSSADGCRDPNQVRLRRTTTVKPSTEYQVEAAGMEPGLDPDAESTTDERIKSLKTPCQITVVEYNEERMQISEFWNEEIVDFLAKGRPDWVKVRWINCNGMAKPGHLENATDKVQGFHGRSFVR